MDSHRCKLCSRRFLNGRALGGHMKAHLSFLPRPPTPTPTTHSSSTASDDDTPAINALRDNPRKSIKFSFSSSRNSSPLDGDSDAESRDCGGSPGKRRSRRRIDGGGADSPETEPVSSVSDTSPEEDVAMCLMMLCRDDGWRKKVEENGADSVQKKLHQCEVCNKCFRSSQALGGHRIIHRKKVIVAAEAEAEEEEKIVSTSNKRKSFGSSRDLNRYSRRVFECPFCGKGFGSGQALGGHKRSHMMGGGSSSSWAVGGGEKIITSTADNNTNNNSCIDLNLPAPTEDEDVHSVVSDDGGGSG